MLNTWIEVGPSVGIVQLPPRGWHVHLTTALAQLSGTTLHHWNIAHIGPLVLRVKVKGERGVGNRMENVKGEGGTGEEGMQGEVVWGKGSGWRRRQRRREGHGIWEGVEGGGGAPLRARWGQLH